LRIKSSRALTLTAFLAALLFGAALAGVTPETFVRPACAQQTGPRPDQLRPAGD
jgi:hypothetical protein